MRKPLKVFWAMLVIAIVGIAGKHYGAKLHSAFDHRKAPLAAVVPAPPARQQLIDKFYHATVLMYFPTPDGGEKMACTATAFMQLNDLHTGKQAGYLFATASHCVDGREWVDLTRDEPESGSKVFYHAKVIAQSDRSTGVDAAVLLLVTQDHFDTIPLGHNPTHLGENVINVSGPQGAPKQVLFGTISSLFLNRPIVLPDDGSNWEGYLLAQIHGEGPGSSGSMIVSEDQQAAVGMTVGQGPGMMIFMPIDRFELWWYGVVTGEIPARPSPRFFL